MKTIWSVDYEITDNKEDFINSCSILKKNGFNKLINVNQGYSKLKHEDISLSENACKA